jgi:hypothetical protein
MEGVVIILLLIGAAYGVGWWVWIKRPLAREQAEQPTQTSSYDL